MNVVAIDELRCNLRDKAKNLVPYVFDDLAQRLIPNKGGSALPTTRPKKLNDPIWKMISVNGVEAEVLDLPLMQRLRRVRQLGLAYLIYPSAHHSRFEHSLGAMHAASQVFDYLAPRVHFDEESKKILQRDLRLAAILHDCGHGAFSHVSEHALGYSNLIKSEFSEVQKTLDDKFADPIRDLLRQQSLGRGSASYERTPLAIAELMSALLVLSPSMEKFLSGRHDLREENLLRIAALIIGRPYRLQLDQQNQYYDFVKSLISGDLDADKLDYVARDAYFTGIPIAADVERLITQLELIRHKLDLPPRGQIEADILGVLTSGVPAVEMFIVTRSYLFERIYQHPKVRAAESALERILIDWIRQFEKSTSKKKQIKLSIDFVFNPTGDDGVLASLGEIDSMGIPRNQVRSSPIIDRDLHRRALAVTQRFAFGYDEKTGIVRRSLRQAWTFAADELVQDPSDTEKLIQKYSDLGDDNSVIVSWPRNDPLKEQPEIYVTDSYREDGNLATINAYFDAAQLSKAYEHNKKMTWVYTNQAEDHHRFRVAAAAAIVLAGKFGLMPANDGLTRAKIKPDEFDHALMELRDQLRTKDPAASVTADDILENRSEALRYPQKMIQPFLPLGNDADEVTLSRNIADRLVEAGFKAIHLAEVEAALSVLRSLIHHAIRGVKLTKRNKQSFDEKDFQKEVYEHLVKEIEVGDFETIGVEDNNSIGRVDLVAMGQIRPFKRVAIELKAESREFDKILKARLEQPFNYAAETDDYSRIAILYCRFLDDDLAAPLAHFIRLETSNAKAAPIGVICIGQRCTTKPASGLKKNKKLKPKKNHKNNKPAV